MAMNYIVVKQHRTEYPEPMILLKGQEVAIGDKHEGPEGWDNWYFCTAPGQKGGWAPIQIFECGHGETRKVLEDYSAKELDVEEGETLIGIKKLNGWLWCRRSGDGEEGWVPAECLKQHG